MRVTSKGQVTIPQNVRRRLGIEEGSEVDFVFHGDSVVLVRMDHDRQSGEELVEAMRGAAKGRMTMTTDEIMALTRGEDWLD